MQHYQLVLEWFSHNAAFYIVDKYKNHFQRGCRDGKLISKNDSNKALSLAQWK